MRRRLGGIVPVERVYVARRRAATGAAILRARVGGRRCGYATAAGHRHSRDGQAHLEHASATQFGGGGYGGTWRISSHKAIEVECY